MSNIENENISLPFFGIPKLMPFIRKYLPKIILMTLMGVLSSLIDSASPLFNRYALNHFVAGGSLEGLPGFIALYIGMLVIYVIDNFVSTYMCGQVEMSVDRDLRNAAFDHIQELSFSYFNQNNVGYIHARVMSDTGKIGVMVAWRLARIVSDIRYDHDVHIGLQTCPVCSCDSTGCRCSGHVFSEEACSSESQDT